MDGVFTLIGVIIGAAVGIGAPILTERLRERKRTRQLFGALLVELQQNEHAARTTAEQNLPFDYLARVFDMSCYQRARESGALADLPPSVLKDLMDAYERASRLGALLGRKATSAKLEEFLRYFHELPSKFEVAADGLRQYLTGCK